MHDTDSALVLRNGPVLAPVWVQEDEYAYRLHINLVCNDGVEHGMSLIVWKGVNAHHPPSVCLTRGSAETEFAWVSKDGSPIALDAFRQWVTEALAEPRRGRITRDEQGRFVPGHQQHVENLT